MDHANLFLTPATYRLLRLEYAAALGTAVVLAALHLDEVRWPLFIALFAAIDLVGYIPGAIAWRRSGGQLQTSTFHVLYNTTHSLLTSAAFAGLWSVIVGPEWALLALPIHLCGDRALFGNFLKPLGLSFEPQAHPAYKELIRRYGHTLPAPAGDDAQAPPLVA